MLLATNLSLSEEQITWAVWDDNFKNTPAKMARFGVLSVLHCLKYLGTVDRHSVHRTHTSDPRTRLYPPVCCSGRARLPGSLMGCPPTLVENEELGKSQIWGALGRNKADKFKERQQTKRAGAEKQPRKTALWESFMKIRKKKERRGGRSDKHMLLIPGDCFKK